MTAILEHQALFDGGARRSDARRGCDGSSPMCYPQGDFYLGEADVKLGEIAGAPFYMSSAQFDYWLHTKLIIDVVPGRSGMFSLENSEGVRFLTRSALFTEEELARLKPIERCT